MPRLSPAGKALTGIAGGTIAVDGVVPTSLATATGGYWGFLDDDTIAGQADLGAGYAIRQVVLSTDTLSDLDARGANYFAAGGGEWTAFLSDGTGVFSSIAGVTFPLGALGDMDTDGRVAIILDYQGGRGLRFYDAAGTVLSAVDVQLGDGNIALRGGLCSYRDAAGWHLWDADNGIPATYVPVVDTPNYTIPIVLASGAVLLLERTGRLYLRTATGGTIFVLETAPVTYRPDAIEISAGVVRVVWSTTEGESPTSLRLADVTVSSGLTTFGSAATGAIVWGTPQVIGPALTQLAASAAIGVSLESLLRHPITDQRTGLVNRQWAPWFKAIDRGFGLADANTFTGVLGQTQGGTGVTTGLTVLNAQNIVGVIPVANLPAFPDELDDLTDVDAAAPTDGDVLTWVDGNSAWEPVAPSAGSFALDDLTDVDAVTPSDGDVLTWVDGNSAWEPAAPVASALVLLESHTASSSASLDFTAWYSTSYDEYVLELVGLVPATDDQALWLRVSTDGGSNYVSTNSYQWGAQGMPMTGGWGSANGGGSVAQIVITPNNDNASTAGVSGSLKLFAPGSTSLYTFVAGKATHLHNNGAYYVWETAGVYLATTAVNAFQLLFATGNIASGIARVYGVAK